MDNSFQLLDIILFAGVAGFLLFRLRSVLGRRTGNERRRPDPFARTPVTPPPAAGASPFNPATPTTIAAQPTPSPADSRSDGLAALQAADPSFSAEAFLAGARTAFEMIVKAFAAGDTTALQPLLSPDVFAAFSSAIRARRDAKETHETTLTSIKAATIEHVAIEGLIGLVTVKLVSDQVNVTRDAAGKVVEGDPDKTIEKTDFWTFSRPLRARNPNWTLVATHSP